MLQAEADAAALREQLAQTEAKEREKAETAVQTQVGGVDMLQLYLPLNL